MAPIADKAVDSIMKRLQTIIASWRILNTRHPGFIAEFFVSWIGLEQVQETLSVRSLIVVELCDNRWILA